MMIKNVIFDVGKVLIEWSPEVSMDILGFTPEEKQAVMKVLFVIRVSGTRKTAAC